MTNIYIYFYNENTDTFETEGDINEAFAKWETIWAKYGDEMTALEACFDAANKGCSGIAIAGYEFGFENLENLKQISKA